MTSLEEKEKQTQRECACVGSRSENEERRPSLSPAEKAASGEEPEQNLLRPKSNIQPELQISICLSMSLSRAKTTPKKVRVSRQRTEHREKCVVNARLSARNRLYHLASTLHLFTLKCTRQTDLIRSTQLQQDTISWTKKKTQIH
jgi:hypothetical protein